MIKLSEKVLVIGSGVVGSSVIKFLINFGITNITLSEEIDNIKKSNNLFGVNTLSSYQGRGGLGNYWHNVIDLGLFDLKNDIEDLKYVFQNISILHPNLSLANQEIIPFSPFRPSKLINRYIDRISLTSKCTALKLQNSSVQASFEDRTEIFDRVFICSGALNSSDILVNSNLAEQNENVSDHLFFMKIMFILWKVMIKIF